MLDDQEYLRKSLENGLYFIRFITDLCLILEYSIPRKFHKYRSVFKKEKESYMQIFHKIFNIADYKVSNEYLKSKVLVTNNTKIAEEATKNMFNIPMNSKITGLCLNLHSGEINPNQELLNEITSMNKSLIKMFDETIKNLLEIEYNVFNKKITIYTSGLYIKQFINKLERYKIIINRLLNKYYPTPTYVYVEGHDFADNMLGQCKLVKARVGPASIAHINLLNNYINSYAKLVDDFNENIITPNSITNLNTINKNITIEFKSYSDDVMKKLLETPNIYSLMPIIYDHILRESNFVINKLDEYLEE